MATWPRPSLLLLDEHTAALDPKSADQVIAFRDEIIRREQHDDFPAALVNEFYV